MDKKNFKIFLIVSIVIHTCFIVLVGKIGLEPVVDETLSIEITHLSQDNELQKEIPITAPKKQIQRTQTRVNRKTKPKRSYIGSVKIEKPQEVLKDRFEQREDTITLNTKDPKYLPYSSRIKRKIESVWEYPLEAREREVEGTLTLMFSIRLSGNLQRLELMQSSGHTELDNAAMDAVKSAAPYYPIPERMGIVSLNIIATFDYRIDYFQ